MVAVNTGALAEGLFESELFGHVKGAFTDARTDRIGRFELADGGTIFLDEIGNVPIRQQAKLLRVLESGEIERLGSSRPRKIDVRLISATNIDLKARMLIGPVPRRPAFPAQYGRDSCAAAARAARGYSHTGDPFSRDAMPPAIVAKSADSTLPLCKSWRNTPGRATFENSNTRWSVRF